MTQETLGNEPLRSKEAKRDKKSLVALLLRGSICICLALYGGQAHAENILLKDGRVIAGSEVRRSGDQVLVKTQVGATVGDVGFPVSGITKIEFAQPAELTAATELLLAGKAGEASTKIDPVLRSQGAFKDIEGNWWAQAAQVKLTALAATHGDADADALIKEMLNTRADPEVVLYAKVREAASVSRKGDRKSAIAECEGVLKESKRKETIADAWYVKGTAHLMQGEFDSALLALLHIPVFYPDQKLIMPGVLLACAKAYTGNSDYDNAKASIEELMKNYPDSAEAAQARSELKKLETKSSSK
jgi:TolA-binding protein